MLDPISTYRIQFNKNFTFADFSAIIPYLNHLGVKTVYASPIYEAVPGSMHGYDVINANRINPEIGTLEELRSISAQLKDLDMYWIQDIVPNHMGFHEGNPWLMDVLKNGEESPYRGYFDLITKDLNVEPLMVPFLGDDLDEVIEKGELQLISKKGSWFLKYYESSWPVRESTVPGGNKIELDLKAIAKQQYYRLCCHKETSSRINYRRFFTVNSLICLNVQDERVFSDYHQLTSSLIREGIFQGLRIDHVDGLADPTGYLEQLRLLCGQDTYIVVEKILEPGEALNRRWPVQGTTGYDYLGLVNQLFTNKKAEQKFDKFYKKMGWGNSAVHQQILTKKRRFLATYMQGELDNLFELMMSCGILPPEGTDEAQRPVFRELIGEILVRCPVYRLYSNKFPLLPEEEEVWEEILEDIEKDEKYASAVGLFRDQMNVGSSTDPGNSVNIIVFFQRLMQFSGPLMAKGVEDTLMYTYNRFIGNNEVGDSPELFGISIGDFEEQITSRQRNWPHAMNATATHDTKRGEDARSRLAVLTDLRDEWIAEVRVWQELNESLKASGTPDANDEYFIYQTLIATYPEDDAVEEHYEERLLDYIEKALRESKRNSEWEEPDLEYESHTKDFIQYLLDPEREFWKRFLSFHRRLTGFARLTSLTSVLLKHTLPGVPDTYQGTELRDLSMVDPDNRRPVDYKMRAGLLSEMALKKLGLRELWEHKHDGLIKLYLLQILLMLRREHPVLFADGLYIPLVAKGRYAAHVLAFARRYQEDWLIVCLPVNIAAISTINTALEADWDDTRIVLPENLEGSYLDVLQKNRGSLKMKPVNELRLSVLFAEFPLAALLFKKEERKRGAGVLMHVSSLPSDYGIGDFGPAAENFLSFMADSALKYWQVLPMNPLSAAQVYSPYSATSVMAGNTMLISPEELHLEGLLTSTDLHDHRCGVKRNVSYARVKKSKDELLKKAYQSWLASAGPVQSAELADFISNEAFWLEDFSMFEVIRELQNNSPWPEWPVQFRDRNTEALKSLQQKHHLRLEEIKWQQFIFFRQWARIKKMANILGIRVIGDIPFYTAMDSVDVWAQRKLFALDKRGKITGMAGVPPDYFNEDGQLWGMPVFNWRAMSATGYKWWLDRITKNLELYDLIRLDHFRAFSAYWEVPAGSDTAKHGSWKPGPGKSFFEVLKSKLGKLPLIAEDLGEISHDVYELRDAFGLPGMKVLQFAFGEDVSDSVHAPHNFKDNNCVVYTGTHDNNTTRGWFEEEADTATKNRLETYLGTKITKHNAVHMMICVALSSTADLAIFPMQDFLNKSSKDRMNTPASTEHNWTWRLKPAELKAVGKKVIEKLRLYGR